MAYKIRQRLSCRVHGHRSAAVISRLLQSERTPLTNQLLSVENLEQTFANSGNIYENTSINYFDSSEMLNGYGPALARLWPYSCADFEGDEVPPFCWASCIAHTRVLLSHVSVHLICEMLGICPQTHQQSCRSQLHQALQLTWEWLGFSLLEICKTESTWINTSGDHMCSPHKVHSDALTAVNNREHKRWLVLPAFFLFTQAFWMKSFSKCGVRQPQRASSFQALSSINWSPKSISGLSLELLFCAHIGNKNICLGHIWDTSGIICSPLIPSSATYPLSVQRLPSSPPIAATILLKATLVLAAWCSRDFELHWDAIAIIWLSESSPNPRVAHHFPYIYISIYVYIYL